MRRKIRVHFAEAGQDVIYLDCFYHDDTLIGEVVNMNPASSAVRSVYVGQAFEYENIEVGKSFELCDTTNGFRVWETIWPVERIEDRNDYHDGLLILTT